MTSNNRADETNTGWQNSVKSNKFDKVITIWCFPTLYLFNLVRRNEDTRERNENSLRFVHNKMERWTLWSQREDECPVPSQQLQPTNTYLSQTHTTAWTSFCKILKPRLACFSLIHNNYTTHNIYLQRYKKMILYSPVLILWEVCWTVKINWKMSQGREATD